MVMVPVMHYIRYELEISWEKMFAAIHQPAKSAKIFYLENFRLYGITANNIKVILATLTVVSKSYDCAKAAISLAHGNSGLRRLSVGPSFLPEVARPFSSQEVGSGNE